jgi:hypothetical protein
MSLNQRTRSPRRYCFRVNRPRLEELLNIGQVVANTSASFDEGQRIAPCATPDRQRSNSDAQQLRYFRIAEQSGNFSWHLLAPFKKNNHRANGLQHSEEKAYSVIVITTGSVLRRN